MPDFLPPPMPIPGYSPGQPDRGRGSYGPRYGGGMGMPPPQGAAAYRTPMANQLVEGVNNFIESFKGVRESEKQAARERFFEAARLAEMGFEIDYKKAARDARKGELPFSFEGRRQPQGQPGGFPGVPGAMPPPGPPQGGMPAGMPGQQPQGNIWQRFGRAIQNQFLPPPTPDVPMDAPIIQRLQAMQRRGQMQFDTDTEALKAKAEVQSWMRKYIESGGKDKEALGMLMDVGEIAGSPLIQTMRQGAVLSGKDPSELLGPMLLKEAGLTEDSAEFEDRVFQGAKSVLQYYGGDMERAMKASRVALAGKPLPDDLKPDMSREQMDDALDLTTKFLADYIDLKPMQAFAISQVLADPMADEEEKARMFATLGKYRRADHTQIDMARQRLGIAFDTLDIAKGDKARDLRLSDVLANALIAATDAKGKVDFSKARQQILTLSLFGEKELLPDLSKYLDVAEKNREIIHEGVRPIVIQFGSGAGGQFTRLPPPQPQVP